MKGKNIALIIPPRRGVYNPMPIGLITLASIIKQTGYNPNLIDLHHYFLQQIKFSDFFKQMAEKIISSKPDVLGFSVMSNTLPVALLIAEECKKLVPKMPVIFGGPEISFDEVEVLETFKQVDLIVRGEGEITIVELLKALEGRENIANVLGITFRDDNRITRNPDRPFIEDLDQLPLLDYTLVPGLETYNPIIAAGRGCPYQCAFCSTCRMWKRKVRMKSPQRLAKELKDVKQAFKNSYIEIVDDHFLASRKFANDFLPLLENEGITWGCSSRLDALDDDLIKKLKQAGCQLINLGIETGSPEMQKKIKKNLPLEKLSPILKMLAQNKIKTIVSFIIGFPNETKSQINETLLMALNSKLLDSSVEILIHLFTFLKGSDLYVNEKNRFKKFKFRETSFAALVTNTTAEVSLIKKYPHIFPSFYHIGNEGICPETLQKIAFLFLFLSRSFAHPVFCLLKKSSMTPFQLGEKLTSFFDAEQVDWSPKHGFHFPQFISPFKKFIKEKFSLMYKDFFWWEESFKQWENRTLNKEHNETIMWKKARR